MFHITLPVKPQENRRDNVNDARWETLIRRLTSNCKVFFPLRRSEEKTQFYSEYGRSQGNLWGEGESEGGGGLMANETSHATKRRQSAMKRRPVCGGKSEDPQVIRPKLPRHHFSVYHLFTKVAAQ